MLQLARHRHSMAVVMRRIRSNEFRQPESLEQAVGKVRRKQNEVFRLRKELLEELFGIPQQKLTVAQVRHIEEQNTQLNAPRGAERARSVHRCIYH